MSSYLLGFLALHFQSQNYQYVTSVGFSCPLLPLGHSDCPVLFFNQTAAQGERLSSVVFQHVKVTEQNKGKANIGAVCFVIKRSIAFPGEQFCDVSIFPLSTTTFCFAQGSCSRQRNHSWIRYSCKPYSIEGYFLQYGQRCWTGMKRRALGVLVWGGFGLGGFWYYLLTCHKSDLWMYCNLRDSFCSRLNLWYVKKVFYNYKDQKVNFIFLSIFYIHKSILLYAFFPKDAKHSAKTMSHRAICTVFRFITSKLY